MRPKHTWKLRGMRSPGFSIRSSPRRRRLRKASAEAAAARHGVSACGRYLTSGSVIGHRLFHREPCQEKAIGLYVFPVGDGDTGDFAAVAAEEPLQLAAGEPALPFGSFQTAPLLGILIDN